ncbi:zinc metalloproteinase nas-4-like [Rhopilema esculentum]|uniref:zinc metalloproteinase nas-4-like n=1 Tax=Rhopilema esculentum TaxID=499914 RepID=UPI0031DCA23C
MITKAIALAFWLPFIVGLNPFENEDLFEGDMVLSQDQLKEVEAGMVDIQNGFAASKRRQWPLPIAYEFDPSIARYPKAIAVINASLAEFEENTCLRFKRRTDESAYIYFYKGGGCHSRVGFGYGKRPISLSSWCWYKGAVIHEIAHALGFYHEQSRPDRDSYVKIIWKNIPKKAWGNFQKYSVRTIDSLGVPYDFDSVMHYASKAFNGRNVTIQPLDPNQKIGQRKKLSKLDILQLNLLYRCAGYTNPPKTAIVSTVSPVKSSYVTKPVKTTLQSTKQPVTTPSLSTVKPTTKVFYRQLLVCENRTRSFSCSFGSVVKVEYAMYGRQIGMYCRWGPVKSINCKVPDALPRVRALCEGKQYCKMQANDLFFGYDPCPGTFKYLEVRMGCARN